MSIQHFLIVFDHSLGRLVDFEEFGSHSEKALAAYAAKEREFKDRQAVEIVLIGSDSKETVKVTHANYFGDIEPVPRSRYLIAL